MRRLAKMWQCSLTTVIYLCLSFTHISAAVVESDCVQLDFQQLTAPRPVIYQGTPTTDDDFCFLVSSASGLTISCGNGLRLDDGDRDPADFETGVHAWNETADIILRFSSVVVKYVNLFFYNTPQATGGPVGLPSVDLAYSASDASVSESNSISLRHTVLGNQDLSQSDRSMGYKNVSVVVPFPLTEILGGYNFFRIRLLFPETDVVDWTLLSEIQAFGNTDDARCSVTNVPDGSETITLQEGDSSMQLGPDDVVSTITLSCTVTNEGLFQIQWVLPDMTTVESTWVADGSRTGILQVSRLSGAGEMDYQCQASYVPDGLPSGSPTSSMASATFALDFQAELKVQESPVTAVVGESVTLDCELCGYAGGSPEIEWMMDNEQIENDSEFTITVGEGNRTLQTGGDVPGPSIVSLLTISNPTTSHSGLYVCTVSLGGDSDLATVMLTVLASTTAELKVQESPLTAVVGESVTLGCELCGYAGGSPEIEWMLNNEQIENNSEFTITVGEGSTFFIDVPGPSIVSRLTISNSTTSHSGLYVCTVNLGGDSDQATVMLTVLNRTTEEPTDGSNDSEIAPIIGGVVGGLLGGILLVFILAVTAVAIIRKRREKAPIQDYDYVGPPELPRRPQVIITSSNVAYTSSNAIQGMRNAASANTIQTQANTAYASVLEMQP